MRTARLAFVNLQVGAMTGVAKSIIGQVAAAERLDLPLDYWLIGSDRQPARPRLKTRTVEGWPLARVGSFLKSRVLAQVADLADYDAIILRYPGGVDLDPLAFVRKLPIPLITVHHTKEVAELTSGGRTLANLGRAALEWVNGRRVLQHVSGLVGVTDEIRDYEQTRASRALPTRTIANGIDVASIVETGMVRFTGTVLRILFIAGSHAPWHGTDRLLRSIRSYRGSTRIHLDMVGSAPQPAGVKEVQDNFTIEYHGTLTGKRLDECFRAATVAFSSLAMFRNGLSEGCVLKTREYVARGLPLVIGYDDVDLRRDLPWLLRVPNDDSLINLERVIEFAVRVSKNPEVSAEMRTFASETLDWEHKVRAFIDFGSSFLRQT